MLQFASLATLATLVTLVRLVHLVIVIVTMTLLNLTPSYPRWSESRLPPSLDSCYPPHSSHSSLPQLTSGALFTVLTLTCTVVPCINLMSRMSLFSRSSPSSTHVAAHSAHFSLSSCGYTRNTRQASDAPHAGNSCRLVAHLCHPRSIPAIPGPAVGHPGECVVIPCGSRGRSPAGERGVGQCAVKQQRR